MPADTGAARSVRRLHGWNARILGAFLVLHFANHLTAIWGLDAHLGVQKVLRTVYRLAVVEHLIVGLFITQCVLGVVLLLQRGRPQGGWAWAQAVSGAYLVLFIAQHVGAIMAARFTPPGLDTNSYFAAAVLSRAPFVWYFAPYYVLGVAAVFTHLACALRFRAWPEDATRLQRGLPYIGLAVGIVSVGGLMVATAATDLPAAYRAYLDGLSLDAVMQ